MNSGVIRSQSGSFCQLLDCCREVASIDQQGSKVEIGLCIRRLVALPINGGLEGGLCLLRMAQPLLRQPEVVLGLDIFRAKSQDVLEARDRFGKAVLVVLGASQQIPCLWVVWSFRGNL